MEGLLKMINSEKEPGGSFPSFMSAIFVRGSACVALLRLCSSLHLPPSVPVDHVPPNDSQFALEDPGKPLSALIGEALRRLRASCAATRGINIARQAVASRLAAVQWQWPLGAEQFVEL